MRPILVLSLFPLCIGIVESLCASAVMLLAPLSYFLDKLVTSGAGKEAGNSYSASIRLHTGGRCRYHPFHALCYIDIVLLGLGDGYFGLAITQEDSLNINTMVVINE